jgi:hypothetical protein
MINSIRIFFLRSLCAALCISSLAGCGGTVDPVVTVQPTFTSIQQNVFARSCSSTSCHSTFSQRGALVLEPDKAYSNLVGVRPDNIAARNRGLFRVLPGTPDSSFLMIKLTGPGPDEGDRMPYSNDPLSQQAIDAIRTWIANGAKRD